MQVIEQPQIEEVFASLGRANLLEFRRQFQTLYENTPLRAIKLFFFYLAARGVDDLSQTMGFWTTSGMIYISLLLNSETARSEGIPFETAVHVLPLLNEIDNQFLIKFARCAASSRDPDAILRGLRLAPGLGDYSILIPWLRSLSQHADSRVRACAAKLLCQLRPNRGLIERHIHSTDARIRAGVMEALWSPKAVRSDIDVLNLLRSALADPHHRVVANALVGLYRLGDSDALHKMVSLSSNKEHLFRAATAWAMGAVRDRRAVPALRQLILDRSYTVRMRASDSLLAITPQQSAQRDSENATSRLILQNSG